MICRTVVLLFFIICACAEELSNGTLLRYWAVFNDMMYPASKHIIGAPKHVILETCAELCLQNSMMNRQNATRYSLKRSIYMKNNSNNHDDEIRSFNWTTVIHDRREINMSPKSELCRSFQYIESIEYCVLLNDSASSDVNGYDALKSARGITYYELPRSYYGLFAKMPGVSLQPDTYNVQRNVTLDDCITSCVRSPNLTCNSFVYSENLQVCALTSEIEQKVSDLRATNLYDMYQYTGVWPCNATLMPEYTPRIVASESFPYVYKRPMTCSFRIIAPSGGRVRIKVKTFFIDQPKCNDSADGLYIYDGEVDTKTLLKRLCESGSNGIQASFMSRSNFVTVVNTHHKSVLLTKLTYNFYEPASTGALETVCSQDRCLNNAVCQPSRAGYTCLCRKNFTGKHCENRINDTCASSPCLFNGSCVPTNNTYVCVCPYGTTGPRCETYVGGCQRQPCFNGTCIPTPSGSGYKCACQKGFTGENCEYDINECFSSPCINGQCIDKINGYKCICNDSFTGINCEIDKRRAACSHHACQFGRCSMNLTGSYCQCFPGFTGFSCETNIDECQSSPCAHGTCVDHVNGFHCECHHGFAGRQCNILMDDPCKNDPCKRGYCSISDAYFVCVCEPGYTGIYCESQLVECSSDCIHGYCILDSNMRDKHCICMPEYTGKHCDISARDCKNMTCRETNSEVIKPTVSFQSTIGRYKSKPSSTNTVPTQLLPTNISNRVITVLMTTAVMTRDNTTLRKVTSSETRPDRIENISTKAAETSEYTPTISRTETQMPIPFSQKPTALWESSLTQTPTIETKQMSIENQGKHNFSSTQYGSSKFISLPTTIPFLLTSINSTYFPASMVDIHISASSRDTTLPNPLQTMTLNVSTTTQGIENRTLTTPSLLFTKHYPNNKDKTGIHKSVESNYVASTAGSVIHTSAAVRAESTTTATRATTESSYTSSRPNSITSNHVIPVASELPFHTQQDFSPSAVDLLPSVTTKDPSRTESSDVPTSVHTNQSRSYAFPVSTVRVSQNILLTMHTKPTQVQGTTDASDVTVKHRSTLPKPATEHVTTTHSSAIQTTTPTIQMHFPFSAGTTTQGRGHVIGIPVSSTRKFLDRITPSTIDVKEQTAYLTTTKTKSAVKDLWNETSADANTTDERLSHIVTIEAGVIGALLVIVVIVIVASLCLIYKKNRSGTVYISSDGPAVSKKERDTSVKKRYSSREIHADLQRNNLYPSRDVSSRFYQRNSKSSPVSSLPKTKPVSRKCSSSMASPDSSLHSRSTNYEDVESPDLKIPNHVRRIQARSTRKVDPVTRGSGVISPSMDGYSEDSVTQTDEGSHNTTTSSFENPFYKLEDGSLGLSLVGRHRSRTQEEFQSLLEEILDAEENLTFCRPGMRSKIHHISGTDVGKSEV